MILLFLASSVYFVSPIFLSGMVGLVFVFAIAMGFVARFSFVLPAISIEQPMTFGKSWQVSDGYTIKFIVISAIVLAGSFGLDITMWLDSDNKINEFFGIDDADSFWGRAVFFLIYFWSQIVNLILEILSVGVFSLIFKKLVLDREIN